ncbi:hypothetical protein IAR50_004240 [Cryptococcus sp. DSM 104548]
MISLAQANGRLVLMGLPVPLSQALEVLSPAPHAASVFSEALLSGEQGVQMLHYIQKSEVNEPGEEMVESLCRTWDVRDDVIRLDEKAREYELEVEQIIEAAQTNPAFLVENYHLAVKSYDLMVNIHRVEAVLNIERALQLVAKGKTDVIVMENGIPGWTVGPSRVWRTPVKKLARTKRRAICGKYEAAIRHYLEGLVALWPWTANSSMSYSTATTTGLAQMEQALLGNIAIIALKTPSKTGPKRAAWDEIAKIAFELVLKMRYIPYGTIFKAAERLTQIVGRTARLGTTSNGAWSELVNVVKDKLPDHWAHRQCYTSHYCCDPE